MLLPFPNDWLDRHLDTLVVGDGACACALSAVIRGAATVSCDILTKGLGFPDGSEERKGKPRVLRNVRTILLLWRPDMSAFDVLWAHSRLWKFVLEWNGGDEFQEIRWVIVTTQAVGAEQRQQLARQLLVPDMNGAHGYALWERTSGLPSLLQTIQQMRNGDAQEWEARKLHDLKRQQLTALRKSLLDGNLAAVNAASQAVSAHFKCLEMEIDCYCIPPAHSNGNLWRSWLKEAVTRDVTLEMAGRGQFLLPLLNL